MSRVLDPRGGGDWRPAGLNKNGTSRLDPRTGLERPRREHPIGASEHRRQPSHLPTFFLLLDGSFPGVPLHSRRLTSRLVSSIRLLISSGKRVRLVQRLSRRVHHRVIPVTPTRPPGTPASHLHRRVHVVAFSHGHGRERDRLPIVGVGCIRMPRRRPRRPPASTPSNRAERRRRLHRIRQLTRCQHVRA